MAKDQPIHITVLADDAHKDNLMGLAETLKHKGFVLKQSLDALGVLTGSVDPTKLEGLSAVPGVSAVEEERTDYHTQPE